MGNSKQPYLKMLEQYQVSLESLDSKIKAIKQMENLNDAEVKRRYAMYRRMRHEVRQSIKSISKYAK